MTCLVEFYDFCGMNKPADLSKTDARRALLGTTKAVVQRKLFEGFTVMAIAGNFYYNRKEKQWESRTRMILNTYPTAGQVPDYDLVWVDKATMPQLSMV